MSGRGIEDLINQSEQPYDGTQARSPKGEGDLPPKIVDPRTAQWDQVLKLETCEQVLRLETDAE